MKVSISTKSRKRKKFLIPVLLVIFIFLNLSVIVTLAAPQWSWAIFTSNRTILIVDISVEPLTLVKSLPIIGGRHVAITPDGATALVTTGDSITVIDLATASPFISSTVAGVSQSNRVVISPDGTKALVGSRDSHNMSVLDLTVNPPAVTNISVGSGLSGTAVDATFTADSRYALVAFGDDSEGEALVIDFTFSPPQELVSARIPINVWPRGVGTDPSHSTAVITAIGPDAHLGAKLDSVTVLDISTFPFAILGEVPIGGQDPQFPDISNSGKAVIPFYHEDGYDALMILDVFSAVPTIDSIIPILDGDLARQAAIIDSDNEVLVTLGSSGFIDRYDLSTYMRLPRIEVEELNQASFHSAAVRDGGPPFPPDDTDGVSTATENAAPNGGDGNNDGLLDSQQNHVASLPNIADGQYVTLVAPVGTWLAEVSALPNPSPGNAPAGVTFPVGFLKFLVNHVPLGGNVTINLIAPPGTTFTDYYTYGIPSRGAIPEWFEFMYDGTAGAEIIGGQLFVHLQDALYYPYDEYLRNGQIVHFAAPVGFNDDNDGVSPATEDGAPNGGDGNNDGTPDSQQDNVTSLPNSADAQYVTLVSDTDTNLANVAAIANPSPGDTPGSVDFPIGFLSYTLENLTPGGSATVTLITPSETTFTTYYKYGSTPDNGTPHWYEFLFDGVTGAVIDESTITLHFVDGQRGDNDLSANGQIVDPGAPGALHYNFTGFFEPVEDEGIVNIVNAGRSIPIKFSLDGYQGLDIFYLDYPSSILVGAACSGANVIPEAATVTASNSSLSYDPGTDQYTYVWKTEKGWAGSCRQLNIKLKDGSIHMAWFEFR
jgi:hypothetical protein